jgi:hypothetical protein
MVVTPDCKSVPGIAVKAPTAVALRIRHLNETKALSTARFHRFLAAFAPA